MYFQHLRIVFLEKLVFEIPYFFQNRGRYASIFSSRSRHNGAANSCASVLEWTLKVDARNHASDPRILAKGGLFVRFRPRFGPTCASSGLRCCLVLASLLLRSTSEENSYSATNQQCALPYPPEGYGNGIAGPSAERKRPGRMHPLTTNRHQS